MLVEHGKVVINAIGEIEYRLVKPLKDPLFSFLRKQQGLMDQPFSEWGNFKILVLRKMISLSKCGKKGGIHVAKIAKN